MEEVINLIFSEGFIYLLISIIISGIIGWYIASHFSTPKVKVSKMEQLKKHKETTFVKTKEYSQIENDIIIDNEKFGKFIINPNGTFIDEKNKLMWIQAPWGMDWNGKFFQGNSIPINWIDATTYFGKGAPGYSKATGVISSQDLNNSKDLNHYKKGKCKIMYNSYEDWRLPTAYELDTIAFFDKSEEYWKFQDRSEANALRKELFPNIDNILKRKIWSATQAADACAWASSGNWTLIDEKWNLELEVLFVRNCE